MSEYNILAHSLASKERTKDVTLTENISFSSLILPPEILKGLAASGFDKPSPIQVKALPVGRCGFDLIVKSKSGTGKTLVFGIISLESIKLKKLDPQVLILAPTREIAVQIKDVIKNIGLHYEGLSVDCFIGGLSLTEDKVRCKSCHIAVGTPGRVKQLIQNGNLNVDSVKVFVLDEADKLTEDSFQNDVNEIYNSLPDHKQVIMCSATYPDDMQEFLSKYMRSPVIITVEFETPLLLGLRQYVRLLNPPPNVVQQIHAKNAELLKIISAVSFVQCLVFSNYQTRAESINNFLNENGWNSNFMSAAQNQTERLNCLSDLKSLKCKILVTTDLTSRGIDAANVDLVINYDIPTDAMTYLHRMGRAGRYGSSGNCINLTFIGQDSKLLQNILGFIGGQSLSIPILDDSFNLDVNVISKENHLFAEVVDSFSTYSNVISGIRNSVAENLGKNAKRNKKKKLKSNDTESNTKDRDMLNNIMENKLDTDVSSVLAELASGTFEMSTSTNKLNTKTELYDNLMSLSSTSTNNKSEQSKENHQSAVASKASPEPSLLLQQLAEEGEVLNTHATNSKIEEHHNQTFRKNKALFTVAKMISDVDVSSEDYTDLSTYFSTLKSQENLELSGDIGECADHVETSEFLENIFSLAYKSQISKEGEKWQTLLPKNEKGKLEEHFIAVADNISSQYEVASDAYDEEYYNEDYDFEIEKNIEINYADNSNDYSFMEWVPVVPESSQKEATKTAKTQRTESSTLAKKNKITDTVCYERPDAPTSENETYHSNYGQYFQHCSSNLWQNGLTFDSVANFDQWFINDWDRQLGAVRDFVQKKIYLEEMSKFY